MGVVGEVGYLNWISMKNRTPNIIIVAVQKMEQFDLFCFFHRINAFISCRRTTVHIILLGAVCSDLLVPILLVPRILRKHCDQIIMRTQQKHRHWDSDILKS